MRHFREQNFCSARIAPLLLARWPASLVATPIKVARAASTWDKIRNFGGRKMGWFWTKSVNFWTVSRSFDAEFYSGHDLLKIELRTKIKNRKRSMFLKSSKTNFEKILPSIIFEIPKSNFQNATWVWDFSVKIMKISKIWSKITHFLINYTPKYYFKFFSDHLKDLQGGHDWGPLGSVSARRQEIVKIHDGMHLFYQKSKHANENLN